MALQKKSVITLAQVAARAGVSPGAASVAIRGGTQNGSIGVSEKVAEHVRKVAAEMGYRPSATARAMGYRATRQIGVILPNREDHPVTSPMTFETIIGINNGLQRVERLLVLVRLHDVLGGVEHGSRVFREDALDGAIVIGAMPQKALKWISGQFAKCVWCDTNVWAAKGCVRRDERAAGRMARERIMGSKFSEAVWVGSDGGPDHHFSSDERLAGAESCGAMTRMTISDFAGQPARRFRGRSLIAESYPVAQRLGFLLGQARMAPGRDVSLVCCDDPHNTSWAWPELSRVKFDRYSMGQRAAEMMLNMRDTPPVSVRLAPEWIAGATIAK